uniref:Glutamate receptor n=1 Tax=Gopherus evgoodei TaxID=1825980 RepID=A0A8C4YK11_9SAUR
MGGAGEGSGVFGGLGRLGELSAALLFDAVHVVVGAVRELNRSQEIGVRPLACASASIWQHGTSLMNYLRMVEYEGLTGHVEFNSKGQRINYTLRVLEKARDGHREIGVWYSNRTLAMNATTLAMGVSESLANKTLIVTTILENPYVMRRAGAQAPGGAGEQYEGFCVDMLHELAGILKFRFELRLVEDGLYGAPEANGSWTGMVGELINRKADLAVAAFTITAEREKVIDFSKPFMTLGISILYRVHMGRKPGYFSFLDPFSPAVWLFMLLAYVAVSCVLFLAARLSPYEWYNPHPCLRGPHVLENQYSLGNSLWFPIGGFMQQGSEVLPRALSTRCVSGVWWAFTLIIISSYTANLAAFLTVQRMEVPVESADDLADQTNIEYGTIHAGSTMTFFQNSRYQTYQRMWNYMHSKQPSVFVKSTEEGIARVLNSRYAFLLESTMNEYHRRRNCNLTQIGGLLDTKGYGIGLPLGRELGGGWLGGSVPVLGGPAASGGQAMPLGGSGTVCPGLRDFRQCSPGSHTRMAAWDGATVQCRLRNPEPRRGTDSDSPTWEWQPDPRPGTPQPPLAELCVGRALRPPRLASASLVAPTLNAGVAPQMDTDWPRAGACRRPHLRVSCGGEPALAVPPALPAPSPLNCDPQGPAPGDRSPSWASQQWGCSTPCLLVGLTPQRRLLPGHRRGAGPGGDVRVCLALGHGGGTCGSRRIHLPVARLTNSGAGS